jgi:hypothetical protein
VLRQAVPKPAGQPRTACKAVETRPTLADGNEELVAPRYGPSTPETLVALTAAPPHLHGSLRGARLCAHRLVVPTWHPSTLPFGSPSRTHLHSHASRGRRRPTAPPPAWHSCHFPIAVSLLCIPTWAALDLISELAHCRASRGHALLPGKPRVQRRVPLTGCRVKDKRTEYLMEMISIGSLSLHDHLLSRLALLAAPSARTVSRMMRSCLCDTSRSSPHSMRLRITSPAHVLRLAWS